MSERSCDQDGVIQYKCQYCWDYENDVPIRTTETTPASHDLVYHEADDGCIEYWSCEECGKLFSDADGLHEITEEDLIPPTGESGLFVALCVALFSVSAILILSKKKEF